MWRGVREERPRCPDGSRKTPKYLVRESISQLWSEDLGLRKSEGGRQFSWLDGGGKSQGLRNLGACVIWDREDQGLGDGRNGPCPHQEVRVG